MDVRIGGIYALERIARDSERDHPVVIEVLAAFVREHSRWATDSANPRCVSHDRSPADIQAAVTVIGRRDAGRDSHPVDLSFTCLDRVDLRDANLAYADLSFSSLWGADLRNANFYGASLLAVHLSNSFLCGADFTNANTYNANRVGTQTEGCGTAPKPR